MRGEAGGRQPKGLQNMPPTRHSFWAEDTQQYAPPPPRARGAQAPDPLPWALPLCPLPTQVEAGSRGGERPSTHLCQKVKGRQGGINYLPP